MRGGGGRAGAGRETSQNREENAAPVSRTKGICGYACVPTCGHMCVCVIARARVHLCDQTTGTEALLCEGLKYKRKRIQLFVVSP
jgi:hypothetical protein